MSTTPQVLGPGLYSVPTPPPPLPPVVITINNNTFPGLQLGSFQPIWGVGRSTPVNNPTVHGNITQTPGAPATFAFFPAKITNPAGQPASDNLYCMRPLTTQIDPAMLLAATKFVNNAFVQINVPANCQAFEFDFPTPVTNGTMGIQLLPTGSGASWQVRAFDFNKGSWVALPGTTFPQSLLLQGATFGGSYTCDGKNVTHTAISINGLNIAVTYSQPCKPARVSPLLNAAFQLDATVSALPYTVTLNNFNVSLQ